MTKRVLAFLMVMAMVLSLVPTVVLAEEAAVPGYTMIMQKAHNQTEGSLAIDIYLQANTAEQADVTGYQFTVTPAEGIAVTGAVDATGNDNLAGNDTTFIYSPTAEKSIAVGTGKVLVATITVTGETLPATVAAAATIAEAKVTQAEAEFIPTFKTIASACTDHECAHGTGEWTPVTKADLSGKTLNSGNYYLTEDALDVTGISFAENAVVNICLNGYDISAAPNYQDKENKLAGYKVFKITKKNVSLNVCDCSATGEGAELQSGKLIPNYSWGGTLDVAANVKATVNFYNITIDGSATDFAVNSLAGGGVYLRTNGGTFTAQGVLFKGLSGYENKDGAFYGPNILRGENVKGIYDSCTFVDCGTAILDANNGSGDVNFAPEMIVRDCVITDSREGAHAIDVKHNQFASVTIEGDCQFDVPVFIADPGSKETAERPVILDLGDEADFSIATTTEKTEEELNAMFTVKNMTTKLFYETAVASVTNVNGTLALNIHTHEDGYAGISGTQKWLPWDDPTSLPTTTGYYYLTTDVKLEKEASGGSVRICLNGHTVDASGTTRVSNVYGFTRVFCDCVGHEDPDARGTLIGGDNDGGAVFRMRNKGGGASSGKTNGTNGSKLYLYDIKMTCNETESASAIYIEQSYTDSAYDKKTPAMLEMHNVEVYGFNSYQGGAVRLYNSGTAGQDNQAQVLIDNCVFHDNSASDNGGALYLSKNATVTINNSKFYENTTAKEGAAIFTTSGSSVNLTLDGCELYNNRAKTAGTVTLRSDTVLTIKDTSVVNNTHTEGSTAITGTGVTMGNKANNKIIMQGKVIIANNTGGETGLQDFGVNTDDGAPIQLDGLAEGSRIIFNKQDVKYFGVKDGGKQETWCSTWITAKGKNLDYVDTDADQVLDTFQFATGHFHNGVEYTAIADAAGMPKTSGNYYLSADIKLTGEWAVPAGTEITLCTNGYKLISKAASVKTGMDATVMNSKNYNVYRPVGVKGIFNMEDCTAVYASNGDYISGGITGGSQAYGSAVRVYRTGVFNLKSGKIYGNTISGDSGGAGGGAVYLEPHGNSKSGSEITAYLPGNAVFNMYGGEISGNTYGVGLTKTVGIAVHVNSSKADTNVDQTTDKTEGGTFNMYGGKICDNVNIGSGNIYVADFSTFNMYGGTIADNTSANGGAIYIVGADSVVKIDDDADGDDDVIISGNSVTSRGGAIYTASSKNVTIDGATITGNTSPSHGGAICINKSNVDISNTLIENNVAGTGGAITNGWSNDYPGGTLSITSSIIRGNNATSASAIQVHGTCDVTLKDTTITGNYVNNTKGSYGAINLNSTNSKLKLEGDTVIYGNTAGKGGMEHNIYWRDYSGKPVLQLGELGENAKIGMSRQDYRGNSSAAPVGYFTVEGFGKYVDNFVSDDESRWIIAVGDDDRLYLTGAAIIDGDTITYAADAFQAVKNAPEGAYVKLLANHKSTVAFNADKNIKIDLNGFSINKLTMAEGTKVTLIDSATNDYDVSDGAYGKVTVVGDYETYYEDTTNGLKRYVTIADEDGTISVHRVYLAITTKVLRPTNNGVGFKAIFAGDEVVAANQDKFGIEISTTADFAKTSTGIFTEMTAGIEGTSTPNQKTIILRDILSNEEKPEGMTNRDGYNATIYGRPYIVIGDEVVYGTTVSTTMSALVESALASGDATVVAAVNAMLAGVDMDK